MRRALRSRVRRIPSAQVVGRKRTHRTVVSQRRHVHASATRSGVEQDCTTPIEERCRPWASVQLRTVRPIMNVIDPTIEDGVGDEVVVDTERLAAAIAESRLLRLTLTASAERLRQTMDRYKTAVQDFKSVD